MTKTAKVWLIVGVAGAVLLCCCIVSAAGLVLFGKIIKFHFEEGISQPESADVTVANYDRVQIGMTYPQVAAIFGGPGVLAIEIEFAGYRCEVYQWTGPGGGYALISFEKGRVSEKEQKNLK